MSRKRGLGKGLSALLPGDRETQSPTHSTTRRRQKDQTLPPGVSTIPIDQIVLPEYQPRQYFSEDSLEELADSIRRFGVLQPVVVQPISQNRYLLVAGERRVRAARKAGLKEIPAYIRPASQEPVLILSLVENLQREDLSPIEVALTYKHLIEEYGLTHQRVAELVGVDRSTVTNFLRLLSLPEEIQVALRERRISMGHARALLGLPTYELQLRAFHEIERKNLSVRQVEELVRKWQSQAQQEQQQQQEQNEKDTPEHTYLQQVQNQLREWLPAGRVRIFSRNGKKGRIVFYFDNLDELQTLLERWFTPSTPSKRQ